MHQQTLFNKVENSTIHVHHCSPPESITSPVTVKMTDSQKNIIQKVCMANDMSTSEYIRDASCFFFDWFDHRHKLTKYREAVQAFLDKLP